MMGITFSKNTCTCSPYCGFECSSVIDPSSSIITTTIINDPIETLDDLIGVASDIAFEVVPKLLCPRKHKYNLKFSQVQNVFSLPERMLKIAPLKNTALPTKIDLRSKFQIPYNQGELGSCTAMALCAIVGYLDPDFYSSRLFVYYNERNMLHTVMEDSGAFLSDGIKSLETYGVCSESEWPYIIDQFTVQPTSKCYEEALEHQALQVLQIRNDIYGMKNALAQGHPFVVGIMIYESFESDMVSRTGVVSFPNVRTEQELGGHAVVCCGYDDVKKLWLMRNSWGTEWGEEGYFYLPYAYLTDSSLASDLWTIIKMET